MKNTTFIYIIFFLCFISAQAQSILTFEECLKIAFEQNLSIKEATYSEELAEIQYKSNKISLLPTVNSSVSNNYSYGRSIDPYSNTFINTQFKSYSGNIGSNVILFHGFEKINRIKLAKQEIELNRSIIQKLKDDITIDVASNYTTILYLEELTYANKEQIAISKQQLEILNIRFSEGYIAESDIFKIKSQISNEELNLINNQNLLEIHYLNIKQIMNIPRNEDIKLTPLLTKNLVAYKEEEFSIEESIEKHPLYKIIKLKEEQSKTNIEINRAGLFPTLSLGANYSSFYSNSNPLYNFEQQFNNNANYGFGISLSIPLFNGLKVKHGIKSAEIIYKQDIIRSELEKNNLARILQQASNDLKTLQQKLAAAEISFTFAEKSLKADQAKLEYGKISQSELLTTKIIYNNAQAELIKTKYEYLYHFGLIEFYKNNVFIF